MIEERHGWAECFAHGHRWCVVLQPWESVDWIDCPECGEQGRMVKYVTPESKAMNEDAEGDEAAGNSAAHHRARGGRRAGRARR